MNKKNYTEQEKFWTNSFGKEYTQRNLRNIPEENEFYKKTYGITREEMDRFFLGDIPRTSKILEVGCNIGTKLQFLQKLGFEKLYGIEIQEDAVEIAKTHSKGINIIQGSGFDLPFKDQYFDIVYTSGVLIHIAPTDILKMLDEIYRCSKSYIWGFEYFAEKYQEIEYRGNKSVLWKGNFPQMYCDRFPDLKLIKEKKYKYLNDANVDIMFLLSRK